MPDLSEQNTKELISLLIAASSLEEIQKTLAYVWYHAGLSPGNISPSTLLKRARKGGYDNLEKISEIAQERTDHLNAKTSPEQDREEVIRAVAKIVLEHNDRKLTSRTKAQKKYRAHKPRFEFVAEADTIKRFRELPIEGSYEQKLTALMQFWQEHQP